MYSTPTEKDVIIGRGRKFHKHPGNQRLRQIVATKLDRYSSARNKMEKTVLLTEVVEQVEQDAQFLRLDPTTQLWVEAGDFLSRERVSQCFRDALHDTYKSSKASKKKSREAKVDKKGAATTRHSRIAKKECQHVQRANACTSRPVVVNSNSIVDSSAPESDFISMLTALNSEYMSSARSLNININTIDDDDKHFHCFHLSNNPFEPVPILETSNNALLPEMNFSQKLHPTTIPLSSSNNKDHQSSIFSSKNRRLSLLSISSNFADMW